MNTADPIEDQVRELFSHQATEVSDSRIATLAAHDYAPRIRRAVPLSTAVVGLAAAAVAVIALVNAQGTNPDTNHANIAAGPQGTESGGPRSGDNSTALSPANTIVLAGYQIAFPANYRLGKVDANCTADLHLSSGETKQLVTTPTASCPLLVTSVVTGLPAGADKHAVTYRSNGNGGPSITVYTVPGAAPTAYVPAKLPDGTTVYVTIGDGTLSVDGYSTATQLSELEQGLQVTPTSALPSYSGTPADKPTINSK